MPKRRANNTAISFELSPVMRDELYSLAKADAGRSVASLIRLALDEFLAKRRQEHRPDRNRHREMVA
jgi:hypothetical protein